MWRGHWADYCSKPTSRELPKQSPHYLAILDRSKSAPVHREGLCTNIGVHRLGQGRKPNHINKQTGTSKDEVDKRVDKVDGRVDGGAPKTYRIITRASVDPPVASTMPMQMSGSESISQPLLASDVQLPMSQPSIFSVAPGASAATEPSLGTDQDIPTRFCKHLAEPKRLRKKVHIQLEGECRGVLLSD
jgi:hypothetical protein